MRILVVEDNKKMQGFIKKGLNEAAYTVDCADTGSSAEALAIENEYDLVVLDVMLPDQTGIDTARHMRSGGFTKPILMLTALSSTKDKVKGLDAGADDYLAKPFEFDELLARIRALLRRHHGELPSLLRFADLQMNLITREVKRNEKSIELTRKEFSLLEYLMRNAGRPLSRTSIAEHVWDIHHDHSSNVIDVCVNNLRKKVDAETERKLIHTVIGVGYVLKDKD